MRSLSIGLLCLGGCEALFGGYQRNHPQNCIEDPLVCSDRERCNETTQLCEPKNAGDGGGGGGDGGDQGGSSEFLTSSYPAGDGPYALALADLNTDGKVDITVAANGANQNRPGVQVLLANGQGGFEMPLVAPAGTDPVSVIVADFDSDLKPDVAVASLSDQGNGSIKILSNDGTGRLLNCGNIKINMKDGPYLLASADFNRDSKPDLAVANSASDSISILINNDMCKFTELPRVAVDRFPWRLVVVDVDRDGELDIVVASRDAGKLNQLKGLGNGSFVNQSSYDVGMTPSSIAVGDWNGDGKPDLAVTDYATEKVGVLLHNGSNGYLAPTKYAAGAQPFAVTGADLNGDSKSDLIVANRLSGNISVLLGNGAGGFGSAAHYKVGTSPTGIAARDLNGDGKNDLVVTNNGSNDVTVLLNRLY